MLLSVVLPCFNESDGIAAAVATALEAARTAADAGDVTAWEIVVVDDGSIDDTAAILASLASQDPAVRVVTHPVNRGLGATIRSGLAATDGDVVLYTDADLPCDLVEDLAKALRLMRVYDADVVAAYRHDRTSEGPRRAIYSVVYNVFVRTAFGLRVRDVNFAFKLMRRRVVDAAALTSEGSFIDVEMLVQAHRAGFKTIQFGVDYFPRTRGISTLSSAGTVATILREMVTVGRRMRPPRQDGPVRPEGDVGTARPEDGVGTASTEGDVGTARPEGRMTVGRLRRQGVARRAPGEARAAADIPERRPLVVNADDYGLTAGVSRGILEAHARGIVTSTSVLVLGGGFAQAAGWLAEVGSLDVGIHLAAVGEDPPLLSAREVPSLVDRRGRLRTSWRSFLPAASRGAIDVEDLEREFAAQIEAARDRGLVLSHVDTHQHLHLWPLVSQVVVRLAQVEGIRAMRVPRSAAPLKRVGINRLADRLATQASAAGLASPDWAAGLDEAGRMHGRRFVDALQVVSAAGHGSAELGCHPGRAADARATYTWGYEWERELEWLTSREARDAVERAGFHLTGYRSLPSPVPVA